VPDATPPVMPYIDSNNPSKVQAYVSNFLADSLGHTWCETIGINTWFNSDIIPSSSPIQLNTKSLDIFFPGLAAKYGNDSLVDLHLTITDLHDFASVESTETLSGHANGLLEFWIVENGTRKESAVDLDLNDFFGQFHIDIKGMDIAINVTAASIKSLSVKSDTIGNLTNAVE